jgi:hypothetical protein
MGKHKKPEHQAEYKLTLTLIPLLSFLYIWGNFKNFLHFFFGCSHEVKLWQLPIPVRWHVGTLMVSVLLLLCKLLLSRLCRQTTLSLDQARMQIWCTIFKGRGCYRCWNSHTFMCTVTGHCSFSEKRVQMDINVKEVIAGHVTQPNNNVWDFQSPIYEHYLRVRHRCGIIVKNAWYFSILWNKLPSPICTEQRGRLSQAVLCCTTMHTVILLFI